MNQIELMDQLQSMARGCNLPYSAVMGVIDCIIRYYNVTLGFYEEHAIKVFQRFLDTQELNLRGVY